MCHLRQAARRVAFVVVGILGFGATAIGSAAETAAKKEAAAPNAPTARSPAIAPLGPQSVVDPDIADRIIDSNSRPSVPGGADGSERPKLRQREGAKLVERRGRFEIRGDRVIFLATNPDAHYVVLENLSLERVTRVLEESGSQLEWSVSGTLTEFRASNYLQISRALVKSLPAKAEPRRLGDPLATTPNASAETTGFTEPRSPR